MDNEAQIDLITEVVLVVMVVIVIGAGAYFMTHIISVPDPIRRTVMLSLYAALALIFVILFLYAVGFRLR
jgi:uncharacterized protein (UPF0333 family)